MTFAAHFDEQPAGDERAAARRTLRLAVEGRSTGGEGAVTVHNISAAGILIETALPLSEGDSFTVDLPEAAGSTAQVVWASAPMYGCRLDTALGAAALSAARLRGDTIADPAPARGEDFGERLRRLRVERGLSLADVAARLSVSKPTVWAWEHGKARPVERRLAALADALGVTPGGLEPAASGPSEEIERSRRRIAESYGVEPMRVRIMIEL